MVAAISRVSRGRAFVLGNSTLQGHLLIVDKSSSSPPLALFFQPQNSLAKELGAPLRGTTFPQFSFYQLSY